MRNLVRSWILRLKRRRVRKEMRAQGNYTSLERKIRSDGNVCSNCNATLTGPFCHICGQKDDDLDRPIWTLLREILDDTFSTDSRLLKTLFLLVLVPGGLTRAFRMGRRARFVPPLRLYFVVSIVFFLLISVADILILDIQLKPIEEDAPIARSVPDDGVSPDPADDTQTLPPQADSPSAEAEPGDSTLDSAVSVAPAETIIDGDSRPPDPESGPEPIVTPEERVRRALGEKYSLLPEDVRRELEAAEAGDPVSVDGDALIRSLIRDANGKSGDEEDSDFFTVPGLPYSVKIGMFVKDTGEKHIGLRQEDIDEVIADSETPDLAKDIISGFSNGLKDPKAFNDLINDWLPRALFVLMPLFAMLLRVFHWRRDQRYLQQIVFSLHYHTFLYLLLASLIVIVPQFGEAMAFEVVLWGTFVYLLIALKVGQGQGWIKALIKGAIIWTGYFAITSLVMVLVLVAGLRDIS